MINYRDKLERSVSLIPSAAALGAEDRAALVNSLETLLQTLSRKHANIFESPTVKQCIDVLKEIQGQHKELEIKFYEDRAALKAKQKLYKEEGHGFWLYAMKSDEVLSVEITDRDEGALKYLKDINLSTIDNPKRLKLEFFFRRNTYFTNPVLIKTYHSTGDDKPIIEKAIGMEIQWCPGKRLTENCHSFFNFFETPLVLDDDNTAEEVQSRMQWDYDIFSSIRDNIIPPGHQQKKSKGLLAPYDFRKLEKQLEKLFLRERAALEAKYQKFYEPLYTKRYEIVNGIIEVIGGKKEAATDPNEDKATKEKGVPYFWFTAMKNDEVLAQEITEHDEDALKYLKDIKWSRINNAEGFTLEFLFDPNPYFENSVLTKTYRVTREYGNHLMVKKAIGTKIKWHPGKSLMNTLLKKKQRKRSKNAKSMTNTGHRQSFFKFFNPFNPPELPYMPYHEDGSHDMYKDLEQEFECWVELDYAIGKIIRDNVIPHAISLFSGEAVEQGAEYEDLDNDGDLYDDDNGDDNNDNGDDEDDDNDGDLDDEE